MNPTNIDPGALLKLPVEDFLARLASAAPTPGGGSAAALMGSAGAALVAMVCNLTIGKKGYAEIEGEMRELLVRSDALRLELNDLVRADIAAFDAVMAAYRMPKQGDAEKAARGAAIQAALRLASEAPLACMRACAEVIACCEPAARLGNAQVISDAGVAVLAACAGLRSAALNVDVNVPQIDDQAFAHRAAAEAGSLVEQAVARTEAILAIVRGRLN